MTYTWLTELKSSFPFSRIINRPGVPGAVLQTPSSLVDSFGNSSFVKISSRHLHSQTIRDRELKFWEKVDLPNMSCVTCHLSHVTCLMSHFSLSSHSSSHADQIEVIPVRDGQARGCLGRAGTPHTSHLQGEVHMVRNHQDGYPYLNLS